MRIVVVVFAILGLMSLQAPWVAAQTTPAAPDAQQPPFVFRANTVDHDRQNGTVTARGSVQITRGGRTLLADEVIYDERTDTVNASGNISLIEPSGDVIFADKVTLRDDFKQGAIQGLRVRLVDNSRIAAAAGRRTGGFLTEMRKAVYSPCKPCKDNPERAPTWQIKAFEVTHDQVNKEIEYSDAWLEFFGIPVAYIPYLSHPDPTVKKRTGLLAPSYGNDSELGLVIRAPFFINIGPDEDATVTPIFTSKENAVLAGRYRRLFRNALLNVDGSATYASDDTGKDDFRGHFFSNYGIDLTDTWRAKLDLAVTTDDTYLRRYSFDSRDTLINHAQAEGFWNRNYAAVNAYAFQGLRVEDNTGETPIVAPLLDYNFVSQPDGWGGVWSVDSNAMVLTRTQGTDSRRLSTKGGWHVPYTSPLGDRYRLFANVQADGYSVEDQPDPNNTSSEFTGLTGRIFPQAGMDWEFPFVRPFETASVLVAPLAGVIVAPNVGQERKIPNEDSIDIELDDTNIFSASRFTGLDRVEGGHRAYFGLRAGYYHSGGATSTVFLGQSYRLRENRSFPTGSGLEDQISDIVGRVRLSPVSWADFVYRFRIDTRFEPRRHEVTSRFGDKDYNLKTDYLFIAQSDPTSEFDDRQEINVSLNGKITDQWKFSGRWRHDLANNGGPLFYGAKLIYEDDCLTLSLDYSRTFFEDRDIRPSDSIFFRISLRTLGGVGTTAGP